jgi:exopolysaccharide biosynthesis polyprenyl glycosylphosphotransferase
MGRRFLRTVVAADVIALFAAILFATYRAFDVWAPWLVITPVGSLMPSVVLLLAGAAVSLYGSYLSWGNTAPRPSYGRAVAIVASTMAITAVGILVSRSYFSREWLLTTAAVWFALDIGHRFIQRRRPWSESMVIITNEKSLADDLSLSSHAKVIAVVDPLGDPVDVPLIDDVTIVVDLKAVLSEDMARYVSSASVSGQLIRPLVDVYEEHTGRLPLVHILGGWEVTRPVHRSGFAPVKRAIDVFLVLVTLPIWLPLSAIVWIVVKIDSPRGPAIYRQERVGRDGDEFTLIKFRTMIEDAEPSGPQFASKNDPRITRVGKFLRLTRFDELPQLWNVLVGDLSLVGPRPERPVFVEHFTNTIPFYASRHLIRPGVTGWAQVHYGYADGDADTVEKLTFDLYYVKYSSIWLDIHILGKSVWTVITGFGAR